MLRVPFDLGGTTFMCFYEYAAGESAQGQSGCEVERLTWDQVFGLPDIRNNVFRRVARTTSGTGQSNRSAHELQESPSAQIVRPVTSPGWKFVTGSHR